MKINKLKKIKCFQTLSSSKKQKSSSPLSYLRDYFTCLLLFFAKHKHTDSKMNNPIFKISKELVNFSSLCKPKST